MHKIHEKEFVLDDFSHEHMDIASETCLETTIKYLNLFRQSFLEDPCNDTWWQMIQLLPSSYNQTRNVMLNYEVLANIYKSRKNHKLDEWREFCKWIEKLPYSELICGEVCKPMTPDEINTSVDKQKQLTQPKQLNAYTDEWPD